MNKFRKAVQILVRDGTVAFTEKLRDRLGLFVRRRFPSLSMRIEKFFFRPHPHARCVNIGGGRWYHHRWENIDHIPYKNHVDYCLDLRTNPKLPIADGTTALIFTSHMLEHISDENCRFVLTECNRICKLDGIIRISVPDMDKAFAAYRDGDVKFFDEGGVRCTGDTIEQKLVNFFASYATADYSGGPPVSAEDVRSHLRTLDKYEFCRWCASQIPEDAPYKAHVNAYDYAKLERFLFGAGFREIHRSEFRQSSVAEMRSADFDNRPLVSLYMEARK